MQTDGSTSPMVLVVDDSPAVRKFVAFSLRLIGCRVVEAMDGQDALEQLARNPETAMIITDLNMPTMDGLSFVRTLKSSGGFTGVPVVVLSSEQDAPVRAEAVRAGAEAYLVKPFSTEMVQQVARQYLGGLEKSA